MTTVEEFAWSEQKRLDGVDGSYRIKGSADVPSVFIVDEKRGQFEHGDDDEKVMRKAVIDCDLSLAIDSRGNIKIGSDVWQIYRPDGRDTVSQSWQCTITVAKSRR